MKKLKIFLFFVLATIFLLGGTAWGATNDIAVIVDGKTVLFEDAKPFIQPETNRTLVPVRFIAKNLGCDVDWFDTLNMVSISNGLKSVQLYIDNPQALVDGVVKTFDAAPIIKDDRTFVPLRFISEAFDAEVEWIDNLRTVFVKTLNKITEEVNKEGKTTEQASLEKKLENETVEDDTAIEEIEEDEIEDVDIEEAETEEIEEEAEEAYEEDIYADEENVEETPANENNNGSIQVMPLPTSLEDLKNINTEDVLFVEISEVDPEYQVDAFGVAKKLVPAIKKDDRTFDFEKALEIVEAEPDLIVVETMNQSITQNSKDVSLALDKIASLLKSSIGLVLTDKLKASMLTDLTTAFEGGNIYDKGKDKNKILGLTWSSESWEKGKTFHYKMVFGIKDRSTGKILYTIPYQLEIATSKYSKTSWFGLKKDTEFSCSIKVEAIKIAKILDH